METSTRSPSDIAYDLARALEDRRTLAKRLVANEARIGVLADQLRPIVDAQPSGTLVISTGQSYDPLVFRLSVVDADEPVEATLIDSTSWHTLTWPQTTDEPDTIEVEIDAADAYLGPTEDVRLVDPPSDQFPTTLAKPNTLAS